MIDLVYWLIQGYGRLIVKDAFLIQMVRVQSTRSSSKYLDSNLVNRIHLSLLFCHQGEMDFQAEEFYLLKVQLAISWMLKKSTYVFLLKWPSRIFRMLVYCWTVFARASYNTSVYNLYVVISSIFFYLMPCLVKACKKHFS